MSDTAKRAIPETGFLRLTDVLQFIPISRSTWWLWVANGKAPAPIKLGPKTTAWKAEEISAFIEELSNRGKL
ncbi:helix-turn-helix transcriptional regulator [Pseudohongiella sp.]|uniref:AlpA family phage regulatory protein n=1 Tax=marine sediment metagenome TaxID=412755 RepID=A0A0F9W7N1_9ZZZZ|nr:AlpA family phage regulatory protein [Pseudohongiella sp.]HDZ07508.1 AlpA family phage regulatory protein [Pseudohongiella sp.]HEA62987.1 AlpA family phage regulatory protein [Pseudohongiella sp.]